MAGHSLDRLPPELLQEILSGLGWKQQMGVRRVSRGWRAAADACLARRRHLRVREHDLGTHLSADQLEQLLQSMPALQRLDVDGHSSVESLRVDLVASHCRHLVELRLVGLSAAAVTVRQPRPSCPDMNCLPTPDAEHPRPCFFTQLVGCPQLRDLDVSRTGVRSEDLTAAVTACPLLQRLVVAHCPELGPDWIHELARCAQLRELDISALRCGYGVDRDFVAAMRAVLIRCHRLQRLTATRLCDPRLYLPAGGPLGLTHLDISNTNTHNITLQRVLPDLLPGLRHLRICCCRPLNGNGLAGGLPRLRNLQVLNMATTAGSASPLVLDSLHELPLKAIACGRYDDIVTGSSIARLVLACSTLSVFQLSVFKLAAVQEALLLLSMSLHPDRDVTIIVRPGTVQDLKLLPSGGLRVVENRDRLWETLVDSQ